jgi:hypothetical protein
MQIDPDRIRGGGGGGGAEYVRIWLRTSKTFLLHRYLTITINVPVVYMALGFNDFYEGKFITQAIEGVGSENRDFFG